MLPGGAFLELCADSEIPETPFEIRRIVLAGIGDERRVGPHVSAHGVEVHRAPAVLYLEEDVGMGGPFQS